MFALLKDIAALCVSVATHTVLRSVLEKALAAEGTREAIRKSVREGVRAGFEPLSEAMDEYRASLDRLHEAVTILEARKAAREAQDEEE